MPIRLRVAQLLILLTILICIGCGADESPASQHRSADREANLTLFAAASLIDAFTELGAAFEKRNTAANISIVYNFAGSNQLATQIGEGAPADLFASANPEQMNVAIDGGRIRNEDQRVFIQNRLTVAVPMDAAGALTTLTDLSKSGTKIVIATAEVPVGRYALAFLELAAADDTLGAAYRSNFFANIVSYETSVRSVLSKVRLGEADAGIVYRSDVIANATGIQTIEIPDGLNPTGRYVIAPLVDSPNFDLAQQFVDFVLSAEGQQILTKYGFDSEWQ